jgi:hypothetical protein
MGKDAMSERCYYTALPFTEEGPNAKVWDADGHAVCAWVAQARQGMDDATFKTILRDFEGARNQRLNWHAHGAGETHLQRRGVSVRSTLLCELFDVLVIRYWDRPWFIDLKADISISTNVGPALYIKVNDDQLVVALTFTEHFSRPLAHPRAVEEILEFVDYVLESGTAALSSMNNQSFYELTAFVEALQQTYQKRSL